MTSVPRRWIAACGFALGLAVSAPVAAEEAAQEISSRIAALESLGRARPLEAALHLEALLPEVATRSAEHLELLTVAGLVLADGLRDSAAVAVAARLEAWQAQRADAMAQAATTAALLIRASSSAHGGNNLQRADAMLRAALARRPAQLSLLQKYRFAAIDGYIKDHAGRVEDAVSLNHEAMALADQLPEAWRRSESRTALAYSYYGAKQLTRAYKFSQEAIAIAEAAQDPVALGRAHNTAGIVLDGLGDQPGERRSFDLAIVQAVKAGAKGDEVRYRANLADFFLKNGDFKTALAHAERALPLARELQDASSEMVALANMGLAKISMQHIDEGKRLVLQAISIDERRGAFASVADSYLELGSYLERAGDLGSAVQAFHTYRELATKVSQKDQQKAVLAIQEKYDADSRAAALAQLKREQDLKTEQLQRRALQQRLWWVLAAVGLISLGVVVLLYRRMRRANAQLAASNGSLQRLAELDPLTGLSNRRHFRALMEQAGADGTLDGSLFLIDIDHFKQINDRYGHGSGDLVLQEVSRRLRQTLHSDDLVVRWGGEEFLVLMRGHALSAAGAEAQAQCMLEAIHEAPIQAGPHTIRASGSIGFASFPIGPSALAVPWERALNLVDTAMYLAKAHGRNRAYGVKLQRNADGPSVDAIAGSLEAAWQNGHVSLTLLQGAPRPVMEVAA